jgi:hypothetical protein
MSQAIRGLTLLPLDILEEPSIILNALRTQYMQRQSYIKYIVSTKQHLIATRDVLVKQEARLSHLLLLISKVRMCISR